MVCNCLTILVHKELEKSWRRQLPPYVSVIQLSYVIIISLTNLSLILKSNSLLACRSTYFSRCGYKTMTSGYPRRSRLRVGVVQFSPKVSPIAGLSGSVYLSKNSNLSDRPNSREYKEGQGVNGEVISDFC